MADNQPIFCVDSDGCAMDTMTYKHEHYFGPLAADIFNIKDRDHFLMRWNDINLYSRTRGVNRYTGLVMTLEEFVDEERIASLKKWEANTNELSNQSLEREIAKSDAESLRLALKWSERVNENIANDKGSTRPFDHVKDTLEKMHQLGKVYVVSSANRDAVEDEWTAYQLTNYVDDMYCQDRGKKATVIANLIRSGADPKQIIMVGDSPGDLNAAHDNGCWFYPILVNHESESWYQLQSEDLERMANQTYDDVDRVQKFWDNLT